MFLYCFSFFFFFNDTATTEIYTLSLHDALPISRLRTHPVELRDADRARRRPAGRTGVAARGRRPHVPASRARGGDLRGTGGGLSRHLGLRASVARPVARVRAQRPRLRPDALVPGLG